MIDYNLLIITIALMLAPVVYAYGFRRGKQSQDNCSASAVQDNCFYAKADLLDCKKCGKNYIYSNWRYISEKQAQNIAKDGYCSRCAYAIAGQP